MKTVAIVNPNAGGGRVRKNWLRWQRLLDAGFSKVEVKFSERPNHAISLTREAIANGTERILAVGGDGTINEVVNGFFDESSGQPLNPDVGLAVVPAGTGSDFARSIGLHGVDAAVTYQNAEARPVDVGRVQYAAYDGQTRHRYFINASSFGCSGLVMDKVNHTSKFFGTKISFLWGTIKGQLAYVNQRVRLQVDSSYDQEILINTVAVGNARFFGGGMKIAPNAAIDDGVFDITILGDLNLPTLLSHTSKFYAGTHLNLDRISSLRGREVRVTPLIKSPVLVEIDGEQLGSAPLHYNVVPGALKLWAPWQKVEAKKI